MDLNSLARTLAQSIFHRKVTDYIRPDECRYIAVKSEAEVEAVIREAIDKTLEEAIAVCDKHFKECRDRPNCHLFDAYVIRSLKQSNSVVEDEGPCADCGRPKSDSAMHLDSPSNAAPQPLHWFKQSNSGRTEHEAGERR